MKKTDAGPFRAESVTQPRAGVNRGVLAHFAPTLAFGAHDLVLGCYAMKERPGTARSAGEQGRFDDPVAAAVLAR